MVVVPLVTTPVIPAGWVQTHDIVAPDVEEVSVTALVALPEQIV